VRDLDVLQEAARRAEVSVNVSVPTLDEHVWRTTEPGTAPPRQRLRALKTLVDGWGDDVFHTVIRRTVKFSDSTVAGEPITSYAPASPGAQAYRQLALEVLVRCHAV